MGYTAQMNAFLTGYTHGVRGKDPTAGGHRNPAGGARPLGARAGRGTVPTAGGICAGRGK